MSTSNTSENQLDDCIGRPNDGLVVYSSLSDLERRGEYRYPITGTGRLRIGRRWVVATLIDRSCSGFQVALKANKKRVVRNQVLRFRSDAGEFLVRVVRVEGNGELGLEWIDEANSYASSRHCGGGAATSNTLRQTACWALLLLIAAALVICYTSPELDWVRVWNGR